jgi:hypothetical protein
MEEVEAPPALEGQDDSVSEIKGTNAAAEHRAARIDSNTSAVSSEGGGIASPRSPVHFPGEPSDGPVEVSTACLPEVPRPSSNCVELEKQLAEENVFNPFQLLSEKSQRFRMEAVSSALKATSAVELGIELRDIARRELFARNNMFVSVRVPGMEHGTWDELDRTESVIDARSPHYVRKIRLPASTELDRELEYLLYVYNGPVGQETSDAADLELIGATSFSVAALVGAKQMSMEKPVLSTRTGKRKGCIVLSLDMIQHEQKVEETVFDFGFTEDAPVRNRIFYVVSRAIQKGRFSPVYRSEIQTKEQLSKFDDVTLSSQELHGGDACRLFRIEVYRYYKNGKTTLLGFVQTSLTKLKTCPPGSQLYWWPALRGFARVTFKIVSVKVDEEAGRNWFVMRMCA